MAWRGGVLRGRGGAAGCGGRGGRGRGPPRPLRGVGSCRSASSESSSESSGDSSDVSSDAGGRRRGRGPGPRGRRGPSGLPPWVQTISDSILVVRGGGRVPGCAVLRTPSLPAVLQPRSPRDRERPSSRGGLSRSQARLIIPRTISEYFDCCRFARSHSEGLLPIHVDPNRQCVNFRELVRALSEGLLGGRLVPPGPSDGRQSGPQGSPRNNAPPPRIPVSDLRVGALMEGRIVRVSPVGLLIDVGATAPGLLRRRDCDGVPRRLLRRGEALSNLRVISVESEKGRFSLSLSGIDGSNLQELVYIDVLQRIAGWATVELSQPMLDFAAQMSMRSPKAGGMKSASLGMAPRGRGGRGGSVGGVARGGRGRGRGRGNGAGGPTVASARGGAARSDSPSSGIPSAFSTAASSGSSSAEKGGRAPRAGGAGKPAAKEAAARGKARRGGGGGRAGGLRWRPINGAAVEQQQQQQ